MKYLKYSATIQIFRTFDSCVSYVATVADVAGGLENNLVYRNWRNMLSDITVYVKGSGFLEK